MWLCAWASVSAWMYVCQCACLCLCVNASSCLSACVCVCVCVCVHNSVYLRLYVVKELQICQGCVGTVFESFRVLWGTWVTWWGMWGGGGGGAGMEGVPCVLPTASSSKFPSLSSSIVRTKAALGLECNLLKRKWGSGLEWGPPGNGVLGGSWGEGVGEKRQWGRWRL